MLDRTRHVLTIGEYISGWQGGYQCSCGCGMDFASRAEGVRHLRMMEMMHFTEANEYADWDMSNERIEVVQEVNMFPVLHVYWDRYTDDIIPADEESRVLLEAYRSN